MTDRTPSAAPTHRTRAERRAAEATAIAPPAQPLTRAQLRERARSVPADEPPVSPALPEPVARPQELFADPVIGSGIRFDDRPLPPVVHVPQPTPFVRVPRVSYVPVAAANGPATTSLVVAGLALIGGLIANLLLRSDPVLAGLVNLGVVTLLIAAFLLAAVGMTLAVQRPTRKAIPVVALVVSVLALAAVVALVAARLISLGALLAA